MSKILSKTLFVSLVIVLTLTGFKFAQSGVEEGQVKTTDPRPIQALLITGGAWHDFEAQKSVLTDGISERANVEWTIVHEDGEDPEASDHKISILKKDGWSTGFDVVVYSHCSGWVTDDEFINNIVGVHHQGLPAVMLHCAIHSYRRAKTDAWKKLVGVYSKSHGAHRPVQVENLAPEHPIMAEFPREWTTPNGELYDIEKVFADVQPLARAYDREQNKHQVTVWTNAYGNTRVFGTTIGHHTETMEHEVYLDMVTRGLLWACNKLSDDGKPVSGYGPVKFR